MVGDSSSASWLEVPKRISCLFARSMADTGLSSLSATIFGLPAALAEDFLALPLVAPTFDADLAVVRLRVDSLEAFVFVVSFRGIFVRSVAVVERLVKKSCSTTDGSEGFCGAYCPVTRSVIVRGFFLGALPFSGETCRDAPWCISSSCNVC